MKNEGLKQTGSLKIRLNVNGKIITATMIDSKTTRGFHFPAAANTRHERPVPQ